MQIPDFKRSTSRGRKLSVPAPGCGGVAEQQEEDGQHKEQRSILAVDQNSPLGRLQQRR